MFFFFKAEKRLHNYETLIVLQKGIIFIEIRLSETVFGQNIKAINNKNFEPSIHVS